MLENTVHKITAAGDVAAKPEYFFLQRYMRAYEAEWRAFADAIKAKSSYPVTLADGVLALAVAEAATRSYQTGQTIAMKDITG